MYDGIFTVGWQVDWHWWLNDYHLYNRCCVYYKALFSPLTFYFEFLSEVRVAIRCLNVFKHKVEILRWCSQFLIKTFQEIQEWTTTSGSECGPLARANLMTQGTWNFKATYEGAVAWKRNNLRNAAHCFKQAQAQETNCKGHLSMLNR